MRRFVLMVVAAVLPVAVFALDRAELDQLLARAVAAQGTNYLAARADLLAPGTNALPLLAAAAVDAGLDWRQRLVARVGYERIMRGADIAALRGGEWENEPGYDSDWKKPVTGDAYELGTILVPKCHALGLWHYYIETNWKNTREHSTQGRRRDWRRFEQVWPYYMSRAVTNEAEFVWLPMVWMDRLETTSFAAREDVDLYGRILGMKLQDAVPVLVRRYEAYNARAAGGMELYPGARAESFRRLFNPILDFADERHTALLEAYIAEHPALAELQPKLAEVRARPAPAPVPEPPFRLGTTPVP